MVKKKTISIKSHSITSIYNDIFISSLISKMSKSCHRNSCCNKFKTSPKTAMTNADFSCFVYKYFSLRLPWSYSKLGIIRNWDFFIFKTPNNPTINFLQTIIKSFNIPILPFNHCT